jgi:hypothetical protein
LIEKADALNDFIDCDVIADTRKEVAKTIYNEELKANGTQLINAIIFRIGDTSKVVRYMTSILNEIN